MYLRNVWYSGHLPFNMNQPYDRYGNAYNISLVVDERANFVQEKYESYSVNLMIRQLKIANVYYRRLHNILCIRICLLYFNYRTCSVVLSSPYVQDSEEHL